MPRVMNEEQIQVECAGSARCVKAKRLTLSPYVERLVALFVGA